MHYIVGWPKILNLQHLQGGLAENNESSTEKRPAICVLKILNVSHRTFVILTNDALSVWQNEPTVELSCHTRLPASLQKMGFNNSICAEQRNAFQPTHSRNNLDISVSTTRSSILFYRLQFSPSSDDSNDLQRCYEETAQSMSRATANSEPNCPMVRIVPLRSVTLNNCGSLVSMCSVGEYIFAAMQNGTIQRVRWADGRQINDWTIDLRSVNFYTDLINSRPSRLLTDEDTYVRFMQFCPLLNSVAVLLSNGKGALLTSPPQRANVQRSSVAASANSEIAQNELNSTRSDELANETCSVESTRELIAIWPEHLKHATCMGVNDRFRAVAFGGRLTETTVFTIDEESGSLECSFKLKLTTKDYPNAPTLCGSVIGLRWSPDETLLATVWERFGFALWTVFGRLVFSTLSFVQETLGSHLDSRLLSIRRPSRHDSSNSNAEPAGPASGGPEVRVEPSESSCQFVLENVNALEFDAFGYRLLVASETNNSVELACFSVAKTAHSVSPTNVDCGAHVLLHTDTHIMLQTASVMQSNISSSSAFQEAPTAGRSLQTLMPPTGYSQTNSPIRFVALSPGERALAVAGERGFCVYMLNERKWRLFQNEAQEREFFVWPSTFFWFQNDSQASAESPLFIGCVARTADGKNDELRVFSIREKLDNRSACITKLFAVPNESFSPASVTGSPYTAQTFRNRFLVVYSRFANSAILYSIEDHNVYPSNSTSASSSSSRAQIEAKKLELIKVQEVSLASVILQPFSVVSVYLSSLHTESLVSLNLIGSQADREVSPADWSGSSSGGNIQSEQRRKAASSFSLIKSLIINYAGRVFLVQSQCTQSTRNPTGTGSGNQPTVKPAQAQHSYLPVIAPANSTRNAPNKYKPILFVVPAVTLATNIETVWFDHSYRAPLSYEVIWLNAGQSGIRVWLPLIAPQTSGNQPVAPSALSSQLQSRMNVFLSKRIMLAFQPSSNGNGGFYVSALNAQAAQLVGLQCDLHAYISERAAAESSPYCAWYKQVPFVSWSRSHVSYLHSIIVQLLRKNLGVYALEFAQYYAVKQRQSFEVSLELLIHELIEEEAVTKVPIPDPLLPRAVEFLREFPASYYRTLAYVLRKTEMNLWPYVIKSIGPQTSVKDLFEQCLYLSDSPSDSATFCPLNVAACYFLVLQNLEPTVFSKQHALLLLDRALRHDEWTLANDLVRYLKSIDPTEIDDAANSGHFTPLPSPSPNPTSVGNTSSAKQVVPEVKTARGEKQSQLVRRVSNATVAVRSRSPPHSPPGIGIQSTFTSISGPVEADEHNAIDSVRNQLDQTMIKHCRSLLAEYRLRKLGRFAANVPDFQLIAFLKKESSRIFVDCCVTGLNQIHRDFRWPMPILLPTIDNFRLLGSRKEISSPSSMSPSHPASRASLLMNRVTELQMPRTRSPSGSLADDASFTTTLTTGSRADGASSTDSHKAALQMLGASLGSQRGSEQSEAELRYLNHVFSEAENLDFTLLICIVLRDELLFVQLVDTLLLRTAADARANRVNRLLRILGELLEWSSEACLGYYPFLSRLDERVRSVLNVPVGNGWNHDGGKKDATNGEAGPKFHRARIASESCASKADLNVMSRSNTIAFDRQASIESLTSAAHGNGAIPKSKSEGEGLAKAADQNHTSSPNGGAQQESSNAYCVVS